MCMFYIGVVDAILHCYNPPKCNAIPNTLSNTRVCVCPKHPRTNYKIRYINVVNSDCLV